MASELQPEGQIVWERLSNNGKHLALYLAVAGLLSVDADYLQAMAANPKNPFDLDIGLQELTDMSVLRVVTFIEEKREELAAMIPPTDIFTKPISELTAEQLQARIVGRLTEDEREYLYIKHMIDQYEQDPEMYRQWEEPRFKLQDDFCRFLIEA